MIAFAVTTLTFSIGNFFGTLFAIVTLDLFCIYYTLNSGPRHFIFFNNRLYYLSNFVLLSTLYTSKVVQYQYIQSTALVHQPHS